MNRTESNFKKFKNKPTSRIVCWRCKRGNKTLFRVTPKEKGKYKTIKPERNLDYVCEDCLVYGKPPIENASHIYYE